MGCLFGMHVVCVPDVACESSGQMDLLGVLRLHIHVFSCLIQQLSNRYSGRDKTLTFTRKRKEVGRICQSSDSETRSVISDQTSQIITNTVSMLSSHTLNHGK
eukprot:6177607-Pleurochrysis_carterae.AAC.2